MAADPPDQILASSWLTSMTSISSWMPRARPIANPPNRFAAFHLQQAAEKLVKAARLARGLRVTNDHNIELLVDELPPADPWRAKLGILEPLSSYATSYRYPSPTGKRKGGPDNDEVLVWIKTIAGLSAEARIAFAGS